MDNKKVALIILDGWGLGDGSESDAIHQAKTPFFDASLKKYPNSELLTSGEHVGLPDGQMGNSEVGHLNIGAGRVVYQDLVKINKSIISREIDQNAVLISAFDYAKENDIAVHFMGLVSDGGIHSHQDHLYKLCDLAKDNGVKKVFIHAFTDGRDCDPKSGLGQMESLQNHVRGSAGELVSVIGRYYAMDRDSRWDRIKKAYDLLVSGVGEYTKDFVNSIESSYKKGITDEFIEPIVKVDDANNTIGRMEKGDVVVCFNFRTDRCREITRVLTQEDMEDHGMKTLPLYYVTMTNYKEDFRDVRVIFDKDNLSDTLGEVIAEHGRSQIRIAETEKYPHVTFFFSGGREQEFENETRILINSPKVATYDLQPEMSARLVTEAIVSKIKEDPADFICLNFANTDMVGHTGVYEAITRAAEEVDDCLRCVVEEGLEQGYSFLIIADHGNADFSINMDGTPNTAHSKNPVPCILIDENCTDIKNGKLADIAPTILEMLDIEIPDKMSGKVLI